MSHSAKTMPMMPVMMMSAEASKPEAPVVTSSVHVAAAPSAQAVQLPALAVPTQQAMPQPAPQAVANVPVGAMIDPATGAPLPQLSKQNY